MKMYLVRIMRGKTRSFLYGALSVFVVTFLLNVMVLRINLIESQGTGPKSEITHELNKEEAYLNYMARGQRKPKAANENEYLKEFLQHSVIKDSNSLTQEKTMNSFQDYKSAINDKNNIILQTLDGRNEEKFVDIKSVNYEDENDYDEDEDDDEDNEENSDEKPPKNKIFEPGDFVNVSKIIFARPLLKYQDVQNNEGSETVDNNEDLIRQNYQTLSGEHIVTDGIYWSDLAEKIVPKGMDQDEAFQFVHKSQHASVKSIHPPSWNKCGRPKNAYVVLDNGSSFCARYRDPHNKLVLGEVMSFYLSRLLGMDNIPAVVLAITNQTSRHWRNVNISSVQWQNGKVVALIQWTPYMETVKSLVSIPKILLKTYESSSVINKNYLRNITLTFNEISELVQWSSMILFDYITGHYDRFASMQDGAEQEHRQSVLSEKVRNLLKSTKTNKLWFIDNESGLFDAYDLIYNTAGNSFIKYHRLMLQTMCVFEKSMVDSISRLHLSENPHLVLEGFAARHEPFLDYFSKDYVYSTFKEKFKDRISEVYNWIQHCKLKNR
ncbi:four-jointed box protein 1-like [Mytilus galloprovincialis]|uniref:four-jointed box protein 1-like n=1 Tax=Mytilus galloprovincialis TaxID=29158 RepID=UPI003F7C7ED5